MGDRKQGTRWRRWVLGAVLAAGLGCVHAGTREQAVDAAVADGLTTAVGLAAGAAELNPLGPLASVGLKAVMLRHIATLPDTERPAAYAMAASFWSGAAANNLCITAAALTGGAFAPACIVVGVVWGMKAWKESEQERQFATACAAMRAYADVPEMTCVHVVPSTQLAGAVALPGAADLAGTELSAAADAVAP